MYLLGLHNSLGSGVALFKNNKLLFAVQEERLNRIKNFDGFPQKSLNLIYKKFNLSPNKISYYIYGFKKNFYFDKFIKKNLKKRLQKLNPVQKKKFDKRIKIENLRDRREVNQFLYFAKKNNIPKKKIIFMDHHLSHAFSGISLSGYNKCFSLSMDARGDYKSMLIMSYSKTKIKYIDMNFSYDSLGFLYGQITKLLGFKQNRHEGKVLALSVSGNYEKTLKIFEKMFSFKNGKLYANVDKFNPYFNNIDSKLKRQLKKFSRKDIAAGLQYFVEKIVLKIVRKIYFYNNKKSFNLCLSGGLFANIKINQKISNSDYVKSLFVAPPMGDEGLNIGSVKAFLYQNGKKEKKKIPTTMYLGENFKKLNLNKYKNKINFQNLKKNILVESIANDLLDEKVIAYFKGRAEFGPRALCNRSILANPKNINITKKINEILNRNDFMPFGPVMNDYNAKKSLKDVNKGDLNKKFMTRLYYVKKIFAKNHPATVHLDGTSRAQILEKKDNEIIYQVLNKIEKKGNIYSVINTSFNLHEEPIVYSPEDAINTFLRSKIDVLYLENYRIKRM
tara:strand:+ start:2090 stop:3772 length:1683 start_codon:yes stop_codon:yes gene_type:complete